MIVGRWAIGDGESLLNYGLNPVVLIRVNRKALSFLIFNF
jgi:hypothetical protein